MPFDFSEKNPILRGHLEKMIEILSRQTDGDQYEYCSCLWHEFRHEVGVTGVSPYDKNMKIHFAVREQLAPVEDCSIYALFSCFPIRKKLEIIDYLLRVHCS
jgi:hypothetical protein